MASKRSRLKRRSATSSPPEPVFFVDRNLGRHVFPDRLREAEVRVEIHDDYFAQDEQDPVWIAEVGRRGWIVLTADQRLRRVSLETEAIMSAGVRAFVFTGKTDVRRFAEAFLKARTRIERLLATTSSAFIAKIYRDGTVSLVLTYDEWEARL